MTNSINSSRNLKKHALLRKKNKIVSLLNSLRSENLLSTSKKTSRLLSRRRMKNWNLLKLSQIRNSPSLS